MANTSTSAGQRPNSRASKRGALWMSERQLDAYLQTRETLRRLRSAASWHADVQPVGKAPIPRR